MNEIKELISFSKALRVLYVEDDINIRDNYAKVFKELFKDIDLADNGLTGLESFQDKGPYDIVVTDINMPKMNGITMIENILEIAPEQIIIVTSAHDESNYLLKLIELGVEKFLIKPVDFKRMVSVLYKTCKNIYEKQELLEYQHKIEEENLNIANLVSELQKKNLELEESLNKLTQEENIAITLVDGIEKEKDFSEQELEFYSPHIDSVSATEFIAHFAGDIDSLADHLEAIEETMELNIHQKLSEPTKEGVQELATAFSEYSKQLQGTFKFINLAQALEQFSTALTEIQDLDKLKEMSAFLYGISDSLQKFRTEIFLDQTAEDIHFLDNSIISDCLQTQSMFSDVHAEEEDLDDLFF